MIGSRMRRTAALALGSVLVLTASLVAAAPWRDDAEVPRCLRVAVPLYAPPHAVDAWGSVLTDVPAPAYAVLNPDSGPGRSAVPGYRELARQLTARGTVPLGYVHTGYAARDPADVSADVDRWREWYGVTDVFFDEVPSERSAIGLYERYAARIRNEGGQVVLNPGVLPDGGYLELADSVITFEGSAADYARATPASAAGRAKQWHLVHSATSGDPRAVVEAARRRGAHLVYVTPGVLPNPWAEPAPHLSEQLRYACPIPPS